MLWITTNALRYQQMVSFKFWVNMVWWQRFGFLIGIPLCQTHLDINKHEWRLYSRCSSLATNSSCSSAWRTPFLYKYVNPTCESKETWWRHQMKTFSALLNHLCGEFTGHRWIPHKGQWRGALMFSLICALNKRFSKQSWGWDAITPIMTSL